jgi:hypothetical protein
MLETLFVKSPETLVAFTFIVCAAVVALTAIVAHQWRSVRLSEVEASLKQDMLNRGLSADEIERVLRASAKPTNSRPPWLSDSKGVVSDNEYYLVEKLLEEGKSAKEIARIIKVLKGGADAGLPGPTETPVRS